MSTLGDSLLLSTIAPYVEAQHMPTTDTLAPVTTFIVPVYQSLIGTLLTAVVGLLTGWQSPTVGNGYLVGGPTFAQSYELVFTRV